jgi:hypothetical protein
MSSRRMAFNVFAAAALAVLSLRSPAAAAESRMLSLVKAPSLEVPAELADSPMVAPVRLDLAALERLDERRLSLPLPNGQVLSVQRTDVERRGPGDYAWRGRMFDEKGQVNGYVTLTVWKNRVMGRIVTPGKIWKIVPEGRRHWLAQAVESNLTCGTNERSEIADLVLKSAGAQEGAEGPELATAAADAFTRMRLVVVYPRETTQGDAGRLQQLIRTAVDDGNTALANSGINARIDLVLMREVNHKESQDPVEDLEFLYYDPAMVALRRQANAKLISIITNKSPGICGIANVMDRAEYEGRATALGVSLVRRGCLDDQVLAHELGHNLGAHHDPVNAPPPSEALEPYTFGHFSLEGSFRTVMSYETECPGCTRIDNFSNPNVSFAGLPTGIANQRDNARLLEVTRSRYATSSTTPGAVCRPGADRLCLLKKRFQVELVWENQFNGTSGTGRAAPRTDAAGFFSFGDPSNLELMVKMLDFGDVVKVFWGQLTNLRYRLIVTDTRTGQSKTYQNTPGECGGIDQGAFPGGAADLGLDAATLAPPLLTGKAATCRTAGGDLCLDNRFSVNVSWRNPGSGAQGQGVAVPFSKVTGAFHFGDPSNLELMAKVINQGERIDFFWGALSDLEYVINVTDTLTGQVKTYSNAAGRYCGGLAVDAF